MNIGMAVFLVLAVNFSDDRPEPPERDETSGRRTLGGKQFWTDFLVLHHWRIQQHAGTGHYRLLNSRDRAIVSGSFEKCKNHLDLVQQNRDFPAIESPVVVTIHGLGRSRSSMEPMGKFLQEQNGYTWVNFGYASTRKDIKAHVRALRSVLDHLAANFKPKPQDDNEFVVHFVGHSLGNIVVRFLLGEIERNQEKNAWTIGRTVMLAPPNKGSAMASLLKKSRTFKVIAGKSGKNLALDWATIEEQLATPKSFGIIAGGRRNGSGYNPLLKGDDDLIVSVEETKLAGATDFLIVPSVHTYIMNKTVVQSATSKFLAKGYFTSGQKRNPIDE